MKIDVLDRGSVELLDKMGSDLTTVESARVSFNRGASELGPREERLIRYLAEHEHTSPFRHATLMFRFKAPLFVARQLWKHCVGITPEFDLEDRFSGFSGGVKDAGWNEACLTGDTEVTFLQRSQRISPVKLRIDQIVAMWREPWRRERLRTKPVRVLNERTNCFETSYIRDVIERGEQDVFEVEFSNGKRVRCTKSHRFLTDAGWMTLDQALHLQIVANGMIAFAAGRKFTANGLPVAGNGKYRDRSWLATQRANGLSLQQMAELSECTTHTVRKWLRIYGLSFTRSEKYVSKARDFDKLVSMCEPCHRTLHAHSGELEFAQSYLGPTFQIDPTRQPKKAAPRRVTPHLVDVVNVRYVGRLPTFDLEIAEHHNFVANGMVVHNSGRYVELQEEFYVPAEWRAQSASNKQGSAGPLEDQQAAAAAYRAGLEAAYSAYRQLLELGVAKEQARTVLPQSVFTQWIWTGSLQAFLHVVDLRVKPDAQWETQQYGLAIERILAEHFPVCLEKWRNRGGRG